MRGSIWGGRLTWRTGGASAPRPGAAPPRTPGSARGSCAARGRCPATPTAAARRRTPASSSASPARAAPRPRSSFPAISGMSSGRWRSGGSGMRTTARRKKRSERKRPGVHLGAQVAVGGGDDADVDRQVRVGAHAADLRASRARAAAWAAARAAARRSRRGRWCRRRPPRRRPARVVSAPVKAPFSWPNSSLSRRLAGMRAAVDDEERAGRARSLGGGWPRPPGSCRCRSRPRAARSTSRGGGALQQREDARASPPSCPPASRSAVARDSGSRLASSPKLEAQPDAPEREQAAVAERASVTRRRRRRCRCGCRGRVTQRPSRPRGSRSGSATRWARRGGSR